MSTHVHAPNTRLADTGAVTHELATRWMDLLVADDDWVEQEFDELVRAGWGGSPPTCPRTHQGTHEPRRNGPRSRTTRHRGPGLTIRACAAWRAPSRGPPWPPAQGHPAAQVGIRQRPFRPFG